MRIRAKKGIVMKKNIILALVITALLVCIFAVSVSAAKVTYDEVSYTVTQGETEAENTATINGHKGKQFTDTVINVPAFVTDENGVKYYVSGMDASAFESTNATEVYFDPDCTITALGTYCFKNCKSLTKVQLPSKLETLGGQAFNGCSALTALYLPDTLRVIEDGTSKNYAFTGCSNLYFVNELGATEKPTVWYAPAALEEINGEALKELNKLNEVMVFGENLTKITNGYAFADKNSKSEITLVFKGDFTEEGAIFMISCEYKTRNIHFTHENVKDTSALTYDTSWKGDTPKANVYFHSSQTAYTMDGTAKDSNAPKYTEVLFTHLAAQPSEMVDGVEMAVCYCGVASVVHTEGNPVKENVVNATCTTNGSYDTVVYCKDCNVEMSRITTVVNALGHKKGSIIEENKIDADCVKNGSYENAVYCTACGFELSRTYLTIYAFGHDYVLQDFDKELMQITTECQNCGDVLVHNVNEGVSTFKDALTAFTITYSCEDDGCDYSYVTSYDPLFVFRGYSAELNGDRITTGYAVNQDTLAVLPEVSFGVVISAPTENDLAGSYSPLNPDLTPNGEGAVISYAVERNVDGFNLIVNNFSSDDSYYYKKLVMCAYVTDGEGVDYVCYNGSGKATANDYATSVTFDFIAKECVEKYTVSYSCDTEMGTLEGETSQTVHEGNSASTVTAVAKEGYQFACWSDGTQSPTINYIPDKNTKLVAYFTPKSTGLPVISINTESAGTITKDEYINCDITLLDTETGNSIGGEVAEIKGRGNSTWEKFDKKPYKFKFEDKQNLFGYGKEKTWVLLADARDYSLIRNMLALNAGLSLSELQYTSKGQSVELYLNGQYRGVYYLCEQIQVKKNRVNVAEEGEKGQNPNSIGYLVEMDAWVDEQFSGKASEIPERGITPDGDIFVKVNEENRYGYVIKDPEDVFYKEDGSLDVDGEYLKYIQSYMQTCFDTIKNGTYEEVCEIINVKSFAQAYIIFEWVNNPDTDYSSVYFYKDADILNEDGSYTYSKLVCDPLWDFDMSIGNVSHRNNEGNFTSNELLWTARKNTWFKYLLAHDEFKVLVAQELVDNEETLKGSVADTIAYARAHKDAYEKNFTVWTNLLGNEKASDRQGAWSVPTYLRKLQTWEEQLVYIENYLDKAYEFLKTTYPVPTVTE